MPVFGQLAKRRVPWTVWVFASVGAGWFIGAYLAGWSSLDGALTFGLGYAGLLIWACRQHLRSRGLSGLAKEPFSEFSLAPDGLYVSGAKVYFRLPGDDVEWAEVRLPKASRLQLNAQRRVWLLGPDEKGRRFLQLPGVVWPRRVKAVREHPAGAVRQEFVEPRPVPPHEDQVLLAHRSRIVGRIRALIACWVLVLVLMVLKTVILSIVEWPDYDLGISVFAVMVFTWGIVGLQVIKPMLKPLPGGNWTELVAVPVGSVVVMPSGIAALSCSVQWANGWWSHAVLLRVDPALAANIWATHRIWVIGYASRQTMTFAGVPGHAVLGRVAFN